MDGVENPLSHEDEGETQVALDGGGSVCVSHCGRTRGPQILSEDTSVCGLPTARQHRGKSWPS
jgi:hypothetical protein